TNPQTGQKMAIPNPDALGPAWLVKDIQFVAGAREEMNSLDQFNPRDTAYVRESFRSSIPFMPQADSTATIQLLKNNNDTLLYQFHSQANQFAVFSEVYYNDGWKAYIDGKEAPIVR